MKNSEELLLLRKSVQDLFEPIWEKGDIEKFDRNDKAYFGAFNAKFDLDFVSAWFKKLNDKYLGSWINWRCVDAYPYLQMQEYLGLVDLPNLKLVTVAEHFGIELQAHDALSDVRAARALGYQALTMISSDRRITPTEGAI